MAKGYVLRTADGEEYVVAEVVHIGRDSSNTIALNDTSASRHHASVWVEKGKLYILDDRSANGVFVNDRRIVSSQPKALRNGDRLRIGQTVLTVTAPQQSSGGTVILPDPRPASSNRRSLVACSTLAVVGTVLLVAVPILWVAAFGWQIPNLAPSGSAPGTPSPLATGTPGPVSANTTLIAVSTPPPLLKPQEYVSTSEELARAVAELNQSEFEFVRAANDISSRTAKAFLALPVLYAANADELDDKLAQVAADAMRVASIANSLARTAVAQEGGSENADKIASHYTSIAQLAAALVIDAQNLRDALAAGQVTAREAASTIAEYGGRLWNPAMTDPSALDPSAPVNPFTPYLSNPSLIPAPRAINAGDVNTLLNIAEGQPPFWLAASGDRQTKTLTLPSTGANAAPVDADDPAVIDRLTTPAGQKSDPAAARELAATIIQAGGGIDLLGGQPSGGEVVAWFWGAIAVASPASQGDGSETPPETLPSYPGGSGSAVTQGETPGDIGSTLMSFGTGGEPATAGQVTVTETKPLVSLAISNLNIKQINKLSTDGSSTFEAEVIYEFDVQWSSTLAAPRFELSCISSNYFDLTTSRGSQHISAKSLLILYPGATEAYCYASRNGNTLGSASLEFLVGDAAEATRRVSQLETDSASSQLTLTAAALGTEIIQQTQAASTKSVGATANVVATEVYGTQTAEFLATVTEIARQTENAPTPAPTNTPLPTATFTPALIDSTYHPGNVYAVNTNVVLQPGRLYRICLGGTVFLKNPDRAVGPSDIDYVNGIKVPVTGCVVLEGNGQVATISCGSGEPAEDPGGFAVQVYDLGPS